MNRFQWLHYLASIGYELQPESSILRDATPEPSAAAQKWRLTKNESGNAEYEPAAPEGEGASGAGVVDETTVRADFDVLPMEQWTAAELINYISGDYDCTATELTKRFATLRADRDRLERKNASLAAQLKRREHEVMQAIQMGWKWMEDAADTMSVPEIIDWLGRKWSNTEDRRIELERELEEAQRAHQSLWTRHVEDTKDLMFENRRLLDALKDAISAVASARKGSIGRIDSHYLPQIEVERVDRWRRALHAPESEDGHE